MSGKNSAFIECLHEQLTMQVLRSREMGDGEKQLCQALEDFANAQDPHSNLGGCLFLLCNFIQHMESQRAFLNEALVSKTCTPMSDFELDEGETFDSLCAYFEAHSAYLTAAKETMNDIMPQVAQLKESAAQKKLAAESEARMNASRTQAPLFRKNSSPVLRHSNPSQDTSACPPLPAREPLRASQGEAGFAGHPNEAPQQGGEEERQEGVNRGGPAGGPSALRRPPVPAPSRSNSGPTAKNSAMTPPPRLTNNLFIKPGPTTAPSDPAAGGVGGGVAGGVGGGAPGGPAVAPSGGMAQSPLRRSFDEGSVRGAQPTGSEEQGRHPPRPLSSPGSDAAGVGPKLRALNRQALEEVVSPQKDSSGPDRGRSKTLGATGSGGNIPLPGMRGPSPLRPAGGSGGAGDPPNLPFRQPAFGDAGSLPPTATNTTSNNPNTSPTNNNNNTTRPPGDAGSVPNGGGRPMGGPPPQQGKRPPAPILGAAPPMMKRTTSVGGGAPAGTGTLGKPRPGTNPPPILPPVLPSMLPQQQPSAFLQAEKMMAPIPLLPLVSGPPSAQLQQMLSPGNLERRKNISTESLAPPPDSPEGRPRRKSTGGPGGPATGRKDGSPNSSPSSTREDPQNVLKELVISERDYVKSWSAVVSLIGKVQDKNVQPSDLKTIFFEAEQLLSLHSSLLESLELGLKRYPNMLIGMVFLSKIYALKMYTLYVSNNSTAMSQLELAKSQSKPFLQAVKNWEKETGLELTRVLSSPLKRIGFFANRLLALVQNMPANSPDYRSTNDAYNRYSVLQREIANAKKVTKRVDQQLRVKRQVAGFEEAGIVLEPKRGLVKEGALVFRKKEKKKKCNGYAFLFSDMFLLTQLDKPQSYTYVMHIPLEKTQFEKDPADAKDLKFCIGLTRNNVHHYISLSSDQERNEWFDSLQAVLKKIKETRTYGSPLAYASTVERERSGNNIPWIAASTIEFIAKNSLDKEGIFRLSGSASEMERVYDRIQQGEIIDWESFDDHMVAGLLKQWIRELPEPLMTWGLYDEWVKARDMEDCTDHLRKVIVQLPLYNRYLLQALMKCLSAVVAHSDVNKMNASNVSIVFGPNILSKVNASIVDPDSSAVYYICTSMIENYAKLFRDIERERLEDAERGRKLLREKAYMAQADEENLQKATLWRSKSTMEEERGIDLPESDIIKSGELFKNGANLKNWKKRWFVLKYRSLAFGNSKNQQNVIGLTNCCVTLVPQKPFCFTITFENESFWLVASSEQEREEWMSAIHSCIDRKVERPPAEFV